MDEPGGIYSPSPECGVSAEVDLLMSVPTWEQWRATGIGGSDAPTVCGVNPYRTPYELWLEKTGQTPPFEGNKFTEVGHALEPYAIMLFERETGLKVTAMQMECAHADRPWQHATLDGLVGLPPEYACGPEAVYEGKVKTGRISDWADGPPPLVLYQVQHNLMVADVECGFVTMLHIAKWPWQFKVYPVARDEEMCAEIVAAEERFWRAVEVGVWDE